MPACHKCGHGLNEELEFGRQDTCPGCGSSTHSCLNCRNYDASRYNECTEPVADRVVDKEKFNFCDHFKPSQRAPGATGGLSAREQARQAAEALFRKGK